MKKLGLMAAGLLLSAGLLAFAASTNESDNKLEDKKASCQGACDKSACDKTCDVSSCPPGCPPCK